jgi:flagellar basal-body rod modification protein FlgD
MTVNSIQGSDLYSSSIATDAQPQSAMGKDAFMKLLVNQIKNQDPLEPTDNTAYLSQLAQFSSLEQMQALNENIIGLALLQQNNALMSQLTQSSALIGQRVTYLDPDTGTTQTGTVGSVKIEDNLAVLSIGGKNVPLGNVTEVLGPEIVVPDDTDEETPVTPPSQPAPETTTTADLTADMTPNTNA